MSQNFQRDRERGDDWARDVPWEREQGNRSRNMDWNQEYSYDDEVRGPYAGVGPDDYQRSDERIFEDVCERLTDHGRIDASRIRVNVKNGEVTLEGSVPDRLTRRAAEMVADRVFGVKDVHNNLRAEQRDYGRARGSERARETERARGSERARENERGMPGGGRGRFDEDGGSGVYPASGSMPRRNAEVQGQASWGQGERGAAGYEDSGSSEIDNPNRKDE